ncbi:MCE family protein [Taibaiella lutea]|uniref:MCE family protein n=1 Tax=Taibaiella lutea TaxID=2608001 RepID=A0A5M6CIV4_9BACT|nr:MlaD family protein [Taibaiella lutea]KAA5534956.1 MCE family protein [Taibaiella lutea]
MASAKPRNEIKIGLMVAITITLFILGINFLRGKGLFSSDQGFSTIYSDIQGLQESAEVRLNGLKIGQVDKIELQPDRRIKVHFLLKKEIKVSKGSVVQLTAADLISGTKILNLEMSNDPQILPENSFIQSKEAEGLLGNLGSQVSPVLETVTHTVVSLDTLLNTINNIINDDARKHLNASFASLEVGLNQLSGLATELNKQSGQLAGVIKNVNSVTGNLASNNEQINNTLSNLHDFSTSLKNAPVQETVDDLRKAAADLQSLVAKANDSNGSLGLLLNDKRLYNNLSTTLGTLDTLLGDVKAHPGKYINVSVFGSKARQ